MNRKPQNWNYNRSARRMRRLVNKWNTLSEKIVFEVGLAHEVLSSPHHRDDGKTWASYCEDLGYEPFQILSYFRWRD